MTKVDEKALEAACDAFEPLSSVLRYRGRLADGRSNWHTCDRMAMRHALAAYEAAKSPTPEPADMRAFGASDAAAYKWPDDTPEHRALRKAYCDGAAASTPEPAGDVREAVEAAIRAAPSLDANGHTAEKSEVIKSVRAALSAPASAKAAPGSGASGGVEAGKFGGAPDGYHPLPPGARCRCLKLWADGKGNHWCCMPTALAASPSPPETREGVTPAMLAAAWGAWHERHGGKLGPGPAFAEAIAAAIRARGQS